MDKLYLRARLVNGEVRHLLCRQPSNFNSGDATGRDDKVREELRAFLETEDPFSADWLPTAEGTWAARAMIVDVTPVRVNADRPPWLEAWTNTDDRVLPLTQ